ncbi:MAG TPA: bifunctional aspartate kinase/homoserine dehydrogenase I [Pyrinomonadaceae bacterium]|nr:bifunctional aspartate kinase/homoserine dehydrogenase I [Pyrinomonadaceae bacterium]
MKVLKFGGSSVGSYERIIRAAEIVATAEQPAVVVVSAMQGVTDELLDSAKIAANGDSSWKEKFWKVREKHVETAEKISTLRAQAGPSDNNLLKSETEELLLSLERILEGVSLVNDLSQKLLDRILAFGELLSSKFFAAALSKIDASCFWLDAREVIKTDSTFGKAEVDFKATNQLVKGRIELITSGSTGKICIVMPGFIATDHKGNTTTLGRGGSDYTAAIVAAAVRAEILEIWTDVSGIMTADPRHVRAARVIEKISYREAMELSHFGAKVIYPPTLQPVMALQIPVLVKNTFEPEAAGTLIVADTLAKEEGEDKGLIRGISTIGEIALLTLEGSGMIGIPGFSKRLFDALAREKINVILITQSSSEHSICVAVAEKDAVKAKAAADGEFEREIALGRLEPLAIEKKLAILALVGDRMRFHTGVSGRMFSALGHNGVNIRAIAQGSSERNISAVIDERDIRKAVNTLHEEFFSDGLKQVNIFIAGTGNVGRRLILQLQQQKDEIAKRLGLNLRITGVANSRHCLISTDSVGADDFLSKLEDSEKMSAERFAEEIIRLNLRNSVFVDLTASEEVSSVYQKLLRKSVAVIACNKIAVSGHLENYYQLKSLAREFGADFLFETTVGAGLPVIKTLSDLINSGDKVHRIEAVLSGTLNFVFDNYDGTTSFASVVRQAQEAGLTEPDPRLDLSGKDVARKILILARETGYPLEFENVNLKSFMPEKCFVGDVRKFYETLETEEEHFKSLLETASGRKLKFVASFDREKGAAAELRYIEQDSEFGRLSGKDNIVLFFTDRYSHQPLVVKGAGAGADVTAAGVFADIIRAAKG